MPGSSRKAEDFIGMLGEKETDTDFEIDVNECQNYECFTLVIE